MRLIRVAGSEHLARQAWQSGGALPSAVFDALRRRDTLPLAYGFGRGREVLLFLRPGETRVPLVLTTEDSLARTRALQEADSFVHLDR